MNQLRKKIKAIFHAIHTKRRSFLVRRPHRTFQRTRRRDYVRSLDIPGYFALTAQVARLLWGHKKIFAGLAAVYFVCSFVLVNVVSQDTYGLLADSINDAGTELNLGSTYQAGAIFVGVMTSMFTGGSADTAYGAAQQFIAGFLVLLIWLSTVWILRSSLNGNDVRLRDGLYTSGGPLLATLLLVVVLFVQSIPIILAIIAYAAASASGVLEGTAVLMLFAGAAFLLTTLSLYWMTTTALALIIITLPGMYPMHAMKLAGDIVVGRRVRILLRVLWMVALVLVAWVIIVIPAIFLYEFATQYLEFLLYVPLIPMLIVAMGSLSVVWSASYVYMLYRSIVHDTSEPA